MFLILEHDEPVAIFDRAKLQTLDKKIEFTGEESNYKGILQLQGTGFENQFIVRTDKNLYVMDIEEASMNRIITTDYVFDCFVVDNLNGEYL
jgi:hypothetical protein